MPKMHILLAATATAFSILACGLAEPLGTNSPDEISTSVAATLTAIPTATSEHTAQNASPEPFIAETQVPILDVPLRIAYTDDGNVWAIEGDDPPTQLTFDGGADRVLLSSDKSKIVFTRKPVEFLDSELRTINFDGSEDTLLLSVEELNSLYPMEEGMAGFEIGMMAFIPETHDVLFNIFILFDGPGLIKKDDLLRIDTDSANLTTILSEGEGGDFAISPNGLQIAVVQPESIGLINHDGSNHFPDLLAYPAVMTYSEFRYYAQPVWAPDSSALGVAIPSPDPLGDAPFGTMWRIPLNGDPAINVGNVEGDFYFTQVFANPGLSPTLDRVVFIRNHLDDLRELHIANLDGSEEILYVEGRVNWQGWSPQGSRFTFSLAEPLNVFLGEEGNAPEALLRGNSIHWISDSEFYYLTGSRGDWELLRGGIGGRTIPIVRPAGDFISFDVVP